MIIKKTREDITRIESLAVQYDKQGSEWIIGVVGFRKRYVMKA